MRSLSTKTNAIPPGGNYPYGRLKDDDGSGNGVPVDEPVYGDFHQFFEKLMDYSGVAANGLPDNSSDGFQLFNALVATIKKTLTDDTIQFVIDGGGGVITTGQKGHIEIPFNCTVVGWTALADQSGSVVVDIWKDTYTNFPPAVGDTITGSEKPTISAGVKGQDLTLTTWTTSLAKGDILAFNVDSVSTLTRVTIVLRVAK